MLLQLTGRNLTNTTVSNTAVSWLDLRHSNVVFWCCAVSCRWRSSLPEPSLRGSNFNNLLDMSLVDEYGTIAAGPQTCDCFSVLVFRSGTTTTQWQKEIYIEKRRVLECSKNRWHKNRWQGQGKIRSQKSMYKKTGKGLKHL